MIARPQPHARRPMAATCQVTIRRTTIGEIRERCGDLLRAHWAECSEMNSSNAMLPLDVDWHAYEGMEMNGALFAFAVEGTDGIAGYATVFVTRALKSVGTIVAVLDSLFIAQDHRAGGTFTRLAAACEAHAEALGARVFLWSAPVGSAMDTVLRRRCVPQETVYARRLN